MSTRTISRLSTLTQRLLTALMLTLTLLPLAGQPASPAQAAEAPVRDPHQIAARVKLILRKIIVHDDMDWGIGEANFTFEVNTDGGFCPEHQISTCGQRIVNGKLAEFPSTDGQTVIFNRSVPAEGDSIAEPGTNPIEYGIPIRQGQWYGFRFIGTEEDARADDQMGVVSANITDEQGNIRYGVHTQRAWDSCVLYGWLGDFCGPSDASEPPRGAFSVQYEIARVSLPDLRPTGIRVLPIPGSTNQYVCVDVQNVGAVDVAAFALTVQVDHVTPPAGHVRGSLIPRGGSSGPCAELALPDKGGHFLTAIVDEANTLVEFDESNNDFMTPYIGPKGLGTTGPMVSTGQASTDDDAQADESPVFTPRATPVPSSKDPATMVGQPDLAVAALKVNGRVPDGRDDCKDGKTTVTVVVKNGGLSDPGPLVVRLSDVDQDVKLGENTIDHLEVGQQREVRFNDVRLKKGRHTLVANVYVGPSVTDSNEGDNSLKVTAACKDDD